MFNDNGSFLLALFEFFLFFAWFMCLFWVYGDIFRSKDLGGVAQDIVGSLRALHLLARLAGVRARPRQGHAGTSA